MNAEHVFYVIGAWNDISHSPRAQRIARHLLIYDPLDVAARNEKDGWPLRYGDLTSEEQEDAVAFLECAASRNVAGAADALTAIEELHQDREEVAA